MFHGCKPYCCRTHVPTAIALHSTAPHANTHAEETQLACFPFSWCPQAHHCNYQSGALCSSRATQHLPGTKRSLHSLSSLTFAPTGHGFTLLHLTAVSKLSERRSASSLQPIPTCAAAEDSRGNSARDRLRRCLS